MAGGIADGEQNGLVLAPGLFERFLAPGIPVDGVSGVLQEVGAGFLREAVLAVAAHVRPSVRRPLQRRSDAPAVKPAPTELKRTRSPLDRKSTHLNSSHGYTSYAVFFFLKIL